MPPTSDFSEALFRRAAIVTFNRTFQPHEQNPNLKDDLERELSGILNLALAAYAGALKNGFTIPASSQKAREEWKLETNQVAQFVFDKCDNRPEAAESFNELYLHYKTWVQRNHLTLLTTKTFSTRIQRLGYISGKSGSVRKIKRLQLNKSRGT